ncbi:hypothetical protein KR074_007858, partial [Drosophila pseudoananassae]
INVSYVIENFEVINVNLTVRVPFPGKLLMHIFVRQLSNQMGGSDTKDLLRFRNLDLCKMFDSLRNITLENIQGESVLPSTFFVSCPLVPGFYYVENSTFDVKLVPFRIPDGRYMALLELIQVYEDVIKLVSCRIKFLMKRPPGYKDPSNFDSSEEGQTQITTTKVQSSSEATVPNEDHYEEVTEPSEDDYEPPNDYN